MIILGLLAGLLTLFMAGFGVTLLASRGQASVNLAEASAVSWLLGTGVISILLWLGGFFLSGRALLLAVLILAVVLGTLGWIRRPRSRFFVPRPENAIEWLLLAVIALQCVFAVYLSACSGLGWDGLFNWEIKARYAFLNGGVMPPSYYSDPSWFVTHPGYPLWIPFTELWLYLWMGQAHQFWIKLLFPLFYASGAILLSTFATRLTGRRWIGLAAAAFLFFVPCLTNTQGGLQVGYVDIPISILYLAAIGFLLLHADTGEPSAWRFSTLCLALLPWGKKEGSILWLIAAACAVLVIARRGRAWRTLIWLVPGPALMGAWNIFCHAMALAPTQEFQPMTLTTVRANLPRLEVIGRTLLEEMMETGRWSIFWLIAVIAFLALFLRARNQRVVILFIAVWAPIAMYSATFIFSGWPDWYAHMAHSISRLLLHVVPLAWLAIALAMRPPAMCAIVETNATEDAAEPPPNIARRSQIR